MVEQLKPADPRPEWIIGSQEPNTEVQMIEVDRKIYPYTIVRAGLEPRLPFTTGYPEENALFISTEADGKYAPFILAHEVRDKNRFSDLDEDKRCLASLKVELEDVKKDLPGRYKDYLKQRNDFFVALVKFYEDPIQKAAVTEGFLQGIQSSSEYLHDLAQPKNA